MFKKHYLLSIIAFIVVLSSYSQYDPEALVVLDAMSAKYKKVEAFNAKFTQKLTNESANLNESITGNISVKGDMFYLEVAGQKIYNDGKTMYTFNEEINEVTISPYEEEDAEITLSNVYDLYKSGFKYSLVSTLPKGERVIEMDPESRDKSYFKIKMIIAADNNLQSFTVFERTGNKYVYQINSFEEASLDDSFFQFDQSKYPNVEILDFR